ncbi:MAG TPA: hypothetical protein VE422_00145 [Terriglobia bacterium]|nr:hypothetical protein [Terriglobia bacterium]
MTRFAVRGATAFGLTALIAFSLSVSYGRAAPQSQADYFLAAGLICGIAGGLAYGLRWGLPLVLGVNFALVAYVFGLQDTRLTSVSDVLYTGLASAGLFWLVGGCAVLALPSQLRFDGAKAFAIPGGIAGVIFQLFYGPAHSLFSFGNTAWEQVIMWVIVGTGGGWFFGAELDRLHRSAQPADKTRQRNLWAAASLLSGLIGLTLAALYFPRYVLPLDVMNSLSPASVAADWLWSWGLIGVIIGTFGLWQRGRIVAVVGIGIAAALIFGSFRILSNPWKTQFNTNYASKMLREHTDSNAAIYTGNLILAQAALDQNDIANARRYLLEAATITGTPAIQEKGPDVSVARILLDRGERDTVLEYLHRAHNFWPQGGPVLDRWETTIRAGRRVNFNQRAINPQDGRPSERP